jgi:hypothetical protein
MKMETQPIKTYGMQQKSSKRDIYSNVYRKKKERDLKKTMYASRNKEANKAQ